MRVSATARCCLSLGLLVAACGGPSETGLSRDVAEQGEPLLPDTATIDDVFTMRHGADAFVRAPQFVVADSAEVVFDGGDDPDFDLTASSMLPLPDGRAVAIGRRPARLMVFAADGRPDRIIARSGDGPGDVVAPFLPTVVHGDTVMLFDGPLIEWYTPDGFARSIPAAIDSTTWCHGVLAVLSGPRLLTSDGPCPTMSRASVADTSRRPLMHVVTTDLDRSSTVPVASVLGNERVMFESRYRGRIDRRPVPLRFGRRTAMSSWGHAVTVATGEEGYVIERFPLDGQPRSRLVVEASRRAVTANMRQLLIERELVRLEGPSTEGMVDVEESRRVAREQPFADSLPPYAELLVGTDELLWVIDFATLADTAVTVTAFRSDGAIVKRLTIPRLSWPIWFGPDRVMLREVDGDGVVRFGVYRIIAAPAAPR